MCAVGDCVWWLYVAVWAVGDGVGTVGSCRGQY